MFGRCINYIKRVVAFLGNIETYQNSIIRTEKISRECLWRDIFIDTVNGYEWYKVGSISLGRWAIGYNYAYVLARVLDSLAPSQILEMGLGQSSKIINSFCMNVHGGVKYYDIVEQDKNWIDFFRLTGLAENVNIYQTDIVNMGGVYVYDKFDEVIKGKKYQLISIDGPWGSKDISRIDIIEHIPACLAEDFVILMDDYNRSGEQKSVSKLEEKLKSEKIEYYKAVYESECDMCLIVSAKYRFLTTL